MLPKMSSILRQNELRKRITKSIFTVAKPTRSHPNNITIKQDHKILEHPQIATMNDLPVPCGSWAERDSKRQRKYNKILFAGIISMVMSLAVLQNSDGFKYLKNMQYIEEFNLTEPMSKVWQRYKYIFNKRWMSKCSQPKTSGPYNTCHNNFIQTMNDLPVPCGGWIGRYCIKKRSLNSYLFTGIGALMISMATLVKTGACQDGQNFKNICGFQYHDRARPPNKTRQKHSSATAYHHPHKHDNSFRCDEDGDGNKSESSVPFTVISLMLAIVSLVKFLL